MLEKRHCFLCNLKRRGLHINAIWHFVYKDLWSGKGGITQPVSLTEQINNICGLRMSFIIKKDQKR